MHTKKAIDGNLGLSRRLRNSRGLKSDLPVPSKLNWIWPAGSEVFGSKSNSSADLSHCLAMKNRDSNCTSRRGKNTALTRYLIRHAGEGA